MLDQMIVTIFLWTSSTFKCRSFFLTNNTVNSCRCHCRKVLLCRLLKQNTWKKQERQICFFSLLSFERYFSQMSHQQRFKLCHKNPAMEGQLILSKNRRWLFIVYIWWIMQLWQIPLFFKKKGKRLHRSTCLSRVFFLPHLFDWVIYGQLFKWMTVEQWDMFFIHK